MKNVLPLHPLPLALCPWLFAPCSLRCFDRHSLPVQHCVIGKNRRAVDEKAFDMHVPAKFVSAPVDFDSSLKLYFAGWRQAVICIEAKSFVCNSVITPAGFFPNALRR